MTRRRDLIVFNWPGNEAPLRLLARDERPAFDVLVFDYSGTGGDAKIDGLLSPIGTLSRLTSMKGEILKVIAAECNDLFSGYERVGFIDEDIRCSVSGLNRVLELGETHGLHGVSAAVTRDSYHSHAFMLQQAAGQWRQVPWIEVMMPVLSTELFFATAEFYSQSISGWGIDCFAWPAVAIKLFELPRFGVIDEVGFTHVRPIRSAGIRYSSGLTAEEEFHRVRSSTSRYAAEYGFEEEWVIHLDQVLAGRGP